ncbi:MAG: alpha/beta hydrolase [Pseudomonadota bacterium]
MCTYKKATFVAFTIILSTLLCLAQPAFAGGSDDSDSVPQNDRTFFVDRSKLAFDGIPGLPSERSWGVLKSAGYRIEIPANWNGDLVMYTHGFRGEIPELTVDNPPLRAWFLANGFAWAASSYSKNYYDVRAGVLSTNSLARYFKQRYGIPGRTFITGFSMGGHIAAAAVELGTRPVCNPEDNANRFAKCQRALAKHIAQAIRYDGAVPMCGVMGDTALFDYFGDFSYAAEALAGWPSTFPPTATVEEYQATALPFIIGSLFADNGAGFPARLNERGEQLKALTKQISGGERPVFDLAFPVYQQLLFGFSGSDGTVTGILPGNIYDNITRVYQLDGDEALSNEELALNNAIIRIPADIDANAFRKRRLERVPLVRGNIDIPVVSVHTLGDLFVPFSMQQIYARRVAQQGNADLLVSRAVRDVGHCAFSAPELIEAFADMIQWVDTGVKPAGDDILNAETVAEPDFGCQFTRGDRLAPFVANCSDIAAQ